MLDLSAAFDYLDCRKSILGYLQITVSITSLANMTAVTRKHDISYMDLGLRFNSDVQTIGDSQVW